jgi:hypothetical protein
MATGGNSHQRRMDRKVKARLTEEVTTNVMQRLARPDAAPKNFFQRLLDFAEQPLFTTSVGILGGLVGMFYPPVFLLCGLCVVLAFHRANVVSGKPKLVQIPAYIFVIAVIVALLWKAHTFVDQKLAESSTSLAQLVSDSVKNTISLPPSSTTEIATPKHSGSVKTGHSAPVEPSHSEPAPTLKSLMEGSMPNIGRIAQSKTARFSDGIDVTYEDALLTDYPGGSKYMTIYLPSSVHTYKLAMYTGEHLSELKHDFSVFKATGKSPGESPQTIESLVDTGRVYLYHDDYLNHRQMADIEDTYAKQGAHVELRGPDYLSNAWVEWSRKNGATDPSKKSETRQD